MSIARPPQDVNAPMRGSAAPAASTSADAGAAANVGAKHLQVHVQGIGVYGPGLSGWQETAEVLTGRTHLTMAPISLPAAQALPPAERRRAGVSIKLAFATGFDAVRQSGVDPATLRSVFASASGDCDNCHAILETLASSDRSVSPTRFHNSVHNAPSGYWGIATACRATSTSLSAYDGSFAAGLLEAATQVASAREPCLLLAYDSTYPDPLGSVRGIPYPFGTALMLSPAARTGTLATLTLTLSRRSLTRMKDPALEAMRCSVPAARSLPLLEHLAQGRSGRVTLEYLDGMALDVEVHALA